MTINIEHENESIQIAKKKHLDLKEDNDEFSGNIEILTNLTHLKLNQNAIKGVYLFGCDIEQENQENLEINKVNIMRKARKLKCFQEIIKSYVPDYYISGVILMGRPKDPEKKKFKFYLKLKEINGERKGEISKKLPESISNDEKVYKFKFKRKENDLSKMKEEEENNTGDAQCVANYLNICLGKILKKCGYTKERTSRKILYYNREDIKKARFIKNSDYLFFPALKAVCETYEGGKIFMKLLPKSLLKTSYTYEDLFYQIKTPNNSFEEIFEEFKRNVINKRAVKVYDQSIIKIEDVVYKDPYTIFFKDKNGKELNVGEYFTNARGIPLKKEKILIAVRIIDKGGKLKGDDRMFVHIPCFLLEIIGNIMHEKIDIKELVQRPSEKLDEIDYIRGLIENNAKNTDPNELHNYLGDKFDPVTINGQIIRPPLIIFDKDIKKEVNNGSFELINTCPYSKIKELNKIDIYLLDLANDDGEYIWGFLEEASKELGIKFNKNPTFYPIESYPDPYNFENNLLEYFKKCDEHYKKKENETDFIFMFMDVKKKNSFHYRIFKSVINEFNWSIPTQVILLNEKNFKKKSYLSQFTNILCQMWAKKGNELYICDFSFVPKTMVVAYSSMAIQDKKVLTSISVSIGTKLYEYMFYSKIEENENQDTRISPSIQSLLSKALVAIGKHLKKNIENIVIYRDAVNEKQQVFIQKFEMDEIKKAIKNANDELEKKVFENTKWCLILVSKLNEIKMFLEGYSSGNNFNSVDNIPVGTIVDSIITHKEKYDFYLNSAESRQGTSSSTHYTILHDDTELSAIQIYKLTYYLTYLSYNTTKSIRVPSPLYFVTRRNKFTSENLKGKIINPKFRTLNISL